MDKRYFLFWLANEKSHNNIVNCKKNIGHLN